MISKLVVTDNAAGESVAKSQGEIRGNLLEYTFGIIRESVDSLCRDDADMPMPPYIRKAYSRPNAAFFSLFR